MHVYGTHALVRVSCVCVCPYVCMLCIDLQLTAPDVLCKNHACMGLRAYRQRTILPSGTLRSLPSTRSRLRQCGTGLSRSLFCISPSFSFSMVLSLSLFSHSFTRAPSTPRPRRARALYLFLLSFFASRSGQLYNATLCCSQVYASALSSERNERSARELFSLTRRGGSSIHTAPET